MAYGLKYTVPFKTISDVDCVVNIEVKDYSGSSIELTGGATPFTIPTDESDLLVPIRPSSATLSVFGSDYLRDLYTSDPQGVRITQLTGGNVHWMGFLTPDTFSQNFTNPEFTYEMECVCALSTLKYRKFDFTDDFVSFAQIAAKAIEYAGYSDVIYTNSVRLKSGSYFSARIASANFYDELGDPMTYYEVLEEIAKYAGCTWEPYEDVLYFKDPAAIRSGYVSYTRLSGGVVNLQDLKNVTNYKGTGAKISRIAGKNKAVVNCSLYEIENLLPEFDDEQTVFVDMRDDFSETVKEGKEDIVYRGIIRYFKQPKFKLWKYTEGNPGSPFVSEDPIVKRPDTPVHSGNTGTSFVKTSEYREDEIPSKLSFADELQVRRTRSYNEYEDGKILKSGQKIFSMKSEGKILIHENVYFCISLQLKRMFEEWTKYDATLKAGSDYTINQKASFRIGNYYYNGTGWATSASTFNMPITVKKGTATLNQYYSLDNTNTFNTGVGDLQGYTFKAPDFIMIGECELTLYAIDEVVDFTGTTFPRVDRFTYYKGISVDYGIPNEQSIYGDWVDKDSKNDLIYENVIEGGYVEEADDIDLKICTNPDGKLALSSVLEGNAFLEEIVTDVYGTGQPENILIQRVIDMYDQPRFVIDPTLANNAKPWTKFTEPHLNKQFLVAGGEEDVKMERTRYNLIEL